MSTRDPRNRKAGPIGLTVLAAVVLAIVVVGAVTLGPRPVERPSTSATKTFARPFDYTVPPGTTIEMDPTSDSLHVLGTRGGDVAEGMSFWLVTDVLGDPCLPGGGITPLQPGPAAFSPISAGSTASRLRGKWRSRSTGGPPRSWT